jgi:hypothetical protein
MLPPHEPSGQFRLANISSNPLMTRQELELIHYGELSGPLYRNAGQWEVFYRLVKSFCRGPRGETSCVFEDVWGGIPAPLEDVLEVLPIAFALQSFDAGAQSTASRHAIYRASETCFVKDLPEPYGKWLQHHAMDARWEETEELQMWAVCKLSSPARGVTTLRIEGSTFFVPVIVRLAWSLSEQLGLPQPLTTRLDYLRSRVTFRLSNRRVDLSRLI